MQNSENDMMSLPEEVMLELRTDCEGLSYVDLGI